MTTLEFDEANTDALFAAAVATLALKAQDANDSPVKAQLVRQLYTDMVRDASIVTGLDAVAYDMFAPAIQPRTYLEVLVVSRRTLSILSTVLNDRQRLMVCIDCITTFGWEAEKLKSGLRSEGIAEVLTALDLRMTRETVEAIQKGFKKSTNRLMRASVSGTTKIVILTAGVGLGVLSMGVAAPALGGFIGATYLGLSGAAATSAGLAILGGGSLASGGLGMAGGALLVKATTGVAYKGGTYLATTIARGSRIAFVSQLSQLHVSTVLGSYSANESTELIRRLSSLGQELEAEIKELEFERVSQGEAVLKAWSDETHQKYLDSKRSASNLRGCLRALNAERKSLANTFGMPGWTRVVPWSDAARLAKLLAS